MHHSVAVCAIIFAALRPFGNFQEVGKIKGLARFTAEPTNLVCKAVKRVMQYLANAYDTQLYLGGDML